MCTSGVAIVMSVGRDRWTKGNEGLAPLRHRLPKSIRFLNVYPIDEKPLSHIGLAHIANAPDIRLLRFHTKAIAGRSFRQFVELANENPTRPHRLDFIRVSITSDSVRWLTQYNDLEHLQFRSCNLSHEDLTLLKQSLPACEIICHPPLDDAPAEKKSR